MKVEDVTPVIPEGGLSALDKVALSPGHQRMLDAAAAACSGPRWWRTRKWAEARDLLALSQIAPRFRVLDLDMRETLRVRAAMRVTVPCRPGADGQLRIEHLAVLGIMYSQEAVFRPQPGYTFVIILEPKGIWHPNVAVTPAQVVCLGPQLQPGVLAKELVHLAYGALTFQSVQMSEYDFAGVMNADAARWWQQHRELIPLSRTPFLCPGD